MTKSDCTSDSDEEIFRFLYARLNSIEVRKIGIELLWIPTLFSSMGVRIITIAMLRLQESLQDLFQS